ncbi:MAG TPA: spore germination protein GerW family protein [Candidatus Binatia bacterium]|jgi:uncharacterized spore protein YtfJ|nr:spore germination protein GerW family protein [Candidatus Binatia bacterium]
MDLSKLVTALLSEMKAISASETVVGKPIRVGEATVIPVNRLSLGFGLGAGSGNGNGNGDAASLVGGGVTIQPLAFIVVDTEGHAHMLSVSGKTDSPLIRAIEMLPQVATSIAESGGRLLRKSDDGEKIEHKKKT